MYCKIIFLITLIFNNIFSDEYPMVSSLPGDYVEIDKLVQEMMADNKGSASQMTITKNGVVIYDKSFGYKEKQTKELMNSKILMRIGSVSKLLTASIIYDLIDKNKIRITDRPFRKWSDLGNLNNVNNNLMDITIEMLLSHKGGWDRSKSFDPAFGLPEKLLKNKTFFDLNGKQLMSLMAINELDFKPGTEKSYSNFGYIVLGRVIEDATGTDYGIYLSKFMNNEIGNGNFGVGKSGSKNVKGSPECEYNDLDCNMAVMDSAGGCVSNTGALCLFLNKFLISGVRESGKILSDTFYGSVPGACSFVRKRPDKINYAYIQNGRGGPMEKYVARLDAILNNYIAKKKL